MVIMKCPECNKEMEFEKNEEGKNEGMYFCIDCDVQILKHDCRDYVKTSNYGVQYCLKCDKEIKK